MSGSFCLNQDRPLNRPDQQESVLIDPDRVLDLYQQHAEGLFKFLLGVLKDSALAEDALQTTFVRFAERGHQIQQQASTKSWIYQVAFNEAMLIRRRQATGRRHQQTIAWHIQSSSRAQELDHPDNMVKEFIQQEQIEQIRESLERLSSAQRLVVEKRIYEGKKFREIAEELQVPLATVLARMQTSLKKLKPYLTAIFSPHDEF